MVEGGDISINLASQLDKTNESLDKILESVDTADKVAKLTKSLLAVSSQLDEFKRTSTTERDALVKQLDAMKEQQRGQEKPKEEQEDDALASLRTEFEEFKRTTTFERDALARELDMMKELKRREEEDNLEMEAQQRRSPSSSTDPNDIPENKQDENKLMKCQEDAKGQVEGGIKSILAAISDQFDDEGYMKCCMPEE